MSIAPGENERRNVLHSLQSLKSGILPSPDQRNFDRSIELHIDGAEQMAEGGGMLGYQVPDRIQNE
jgi:hypothetical protein